MELLIEWSNAMTKRLQEKMQNSASTHLTCNKQIPLDKFEQDLQGNEGDLQEWGFPKSTAV